MKAERRNSADDHGDDYGLRLPATASPTLRAIAAVFGRQIEYRCGAQSVCNDGRLPVVELAVVPGVGAEGFTITDGHAGAIRIVGHDERGVLYGVGKLLRTARYAAGRSTPGAWRGASRPAKRVRGIYFATHFYKVYWVPDASAESILDEDKYLSGDQ